MRQFSLFISFLLSFIFLAFLGLFGQTLTVVKGKLTDAVNSDAVPFANIGIKGKAIATFTDENGYYKLEMTKGDHVIVVSCIGYEKLEEPVNIPGDNKVVTLNIKLNPTVQELSTVVVSGSRYEQKIEESIATIEVLKARNIQSSNPTSVDQAIDKIPGIVIVDNEPQIRGGSGFSSGLGSRVMVMVDEIPMLRGDAGRPDWGFLPVDDIEQIELVKGASSVVYGSSAITGAINIRTTYPKSIPETKLNTFFGIYSKPQRKYTTPWSGFNPLQYGVSISHLQQFDNIDLSVGMSYFDDQGYISGVPEAASDTAFNKGEFIKRAKVYFNARVRNKKVKGLTYGLNGNFMYNESAETYFWYDADTNIYKSYPGALSYFKVFSFYVDPYIKYFDAKGNQFSFKNRVYYGNTFATNNQSNRYTTMFNELKYSRKFSKLGELTLVAGIMNAYSHSEGQVFSGILASDGTTTANQSGTFDSENLGIYIQISKKFFKRLTVEAGGRFEYYKIVDLTESKPIVRAGVNFQAAKGTYIRASAGQGYRAPSIGERYITTNSGGFGFYPNPQLQSETCNSYELGIKQLFKIGKFAGMLDFAGFYENYWNYVEFNFGVWGHGQIDKSIGFKFLNTGPAQIYGGDFTFAGEGKLSRNLDLSMLLGYTYTIPKATKPDEVYYANFETSTQKTRYYTYANTSTDTTNNILKYRIQHLVKSDFQFTYKKRLSAGITGRYYGYMKNIDIFLYQLDTPKAMHSGIVKYRQEHNGGNFIVDFRIGYVFGIFKVSMIVNNLMDTEYSLRPITIEAPRTTSLQVLLNI
ncbi:MAG: TonB-dependent receptor [Bacteroidales bacterium]|jgi:iron complex outermembrane receptor protein|nr:TonB-dependent receptor [Bacteroidales bacterium]